ncbi:MAG: hypothetical protein A2X57_10305 [Nitrospirae bacterium GWD2_57_8]|nr:MAG: hypothetical protein A2X57_10305 [Nitrospirae bacterium GWD2_57_8]
MHRSLIIATFFVVSCFQVTALHATQAQSSQPTEVNIKNFPETQQIKGDVQVSNFPATQQVKGSISLEGTTKFIAKDSVVVPPAQRAAVTEMVEAGIIEMDGYTSLVISLQGEMRSNVFSSGTIGVLLVPYERSILRILRDAQRAIYPIESTASTKSGDSIYFESVQAHQRIAFSRYKMYLYNTTNKQAEVNVYLDLAR